MKNFYVKLAGFIDGETNLAFNCSLDKYGFFKSELQYP
jgi:hypothetical protein